MMHGQTKIKKKDNLLYRTSRYTSIYWLA